VTCAARRRRIWPGAPCGQTALRQKAIAHEFHGDREAPAPSRWIRLARLIAFEVHELKSIWNN